MSLPNFLPGPTYLENNTTGVDNPKKMLPFEWRRKLKSSSGNTKFNILYYGQMHNNFKTLVVATDFAPALVIAKDPADGEEILIFDGCRHGFNAMFADEYSEDQINNRDTANIYTDKDGNNSFEIVLSAYYQTEFEEELEHLIDENGYVQLLNGSKVDFDTVKRNAFDVLKIVAINNKGREINIVEEELA